MLNEISIRKLMWAASYLFVDNELSQRARISSTHRQVMNVLKTHVHNSISSAAFRSHMCYRHT